MCPGLSGNQKFAQKRQKSPQTMPFSGAGGNFPGDKRPKVSKAFQYWSRCGRLPVTQHSNDLNRSEDHAGAVPQKK